MQNSKTRNSRLNLQGKLRLKTSNSDSIQAISSSDIKITRQNEAQQQRIYSDDQLFRKENVNSVKYSYKDNEDSFADFKSPKRETVSRLNLAKANIEKNKAKQKTVKSKTKSTVKSRKSDANQPSITCSLTNAQTSNLNESTSHEAFPCPVCLKPFKNDATCINHMKNCAAKNNVSIKQLLEAKKLQDRQAQERKAIGLLAAPIVPEKKKAFRSKNYSTKDDPQLQLVLAMSESHYEAERMAELEEAVILAGIPPECIKEMNEEERKKTLRSFGFTTNKPVTDAPTNKHRKKKLVTPTILQTRSKEDKDRVLTERIACILTGDDALTQIQENTSISLEHTTPTIIRSKLLKEIEKTDNKLWDRTRLTKRFHNFYVKTLKSHFIKSAQHPVVPETHELLAENCKKQDTQTLNTSIVYEPMDFDLIVNNQELDQNCSKDSELLNMYESKSDNLEFEFVQDSSNSWKEALNDSSASDILIFVKNNKRIYAHKLVLRTQCSNILLDVEPLDVMLHSTIEEKISWLDKEQLSALAFLEFIYSGTISKYIDIFYKEELVQQVEQLARLYKKQNLFSYVRIKQQQHKSQRKYSEQLSSNNMHERKGINSNQSMHYELTQKSGNSNSNESCPFEMQFTAKSAKKEATNDLLTKQLIERRTTASPDLFDSEEDEANASRAKCKNNSDLENYKCGNDNIKGEIDDAQDFDQSEHLYSQKTIINLSRSVSPPDNIHEVITPPSGRLEEKGTPLEVNTIFNEQEFGEAITPKCQSPETIVDIKQEIGKSNNDLSNAVTPEYITPTDFSAYITPRRLVYTDIVADDAVPHDSIDESIHAAVTPPKLQKDSPQRIDENLHKVKGELTMFIEKVQRKNAKHIMDTDSETDSPHCRARHKNPFSKRYQDLSYRYLRNQTYHKAISLLEKDVLDDQQVQTNLENVKVDFSGNIQDTSGHLGQANLSTSKSFTGISSNTPSNSKAGPFGECSTPRSKNTNKDVLLSDDEDHNITVNETEMSMYSKYKKSNKYDNSIAIYREQLNLNRQQHCRDDRVASESFTHEDLNDAKSSKSTRSTSSQSAAVNKSKPRIIGDITLVSDSDEDESSSETFIKDKNKKIIFKSGPIADVNKKYKTSDASTVVPIIENDRTFPSEFISEALKPNTRSKIFNSMTLNEQSTSKVIDLSADSNDEDIHDVDTFPDDLEAQSNKSLNRQQSFTRELQTSMNKRKKLEEAEKKSEDIDAEISKILESSQNCLISVGKHVNNDKDEWNEDNCDNANVQDLRSCRKTIDLSPILIVSSPELCEHDKKDPQSSRNNASDSERNSFSRNSKDNLTLEENADFDIDWNMKTPPRETVARCMESLERLSRANLSVRKLSYNNHRPSSSAEFASLNALSDPKNAQTATSISSPILGLNRRNSRTLQNESPESSSRSRNKESSPKNHAKETRKLKIKSSSFTSTSTDKITVTNTPTSQRSTSIFTPELNEISSNNQTVMTPSIDYSLLDTPNLQKELKKFGLKPQSRAKAKALLTHIYKETHSQPLSQKRISNTDLLSDNEEPPAKKQYVVDKTTKKLDDDNLIIAEEMDIDDPNVASISQNPTSIKDAFFNLIKTNRELYNKVLTYEPLALESLHSMLKQNGFKCKINSLMDFLDEQCITFQVKNNKSDSTKIS